VADTKVASRLTPESNQTGRPVIVRRFKVSDIPNAMEKMNWPVAAKLMRHWFDGKPWPTADGAMSREVKDHSVVADRNYVEDTIVKMAWLRKFQSVESVLEELRSVWDNAAGRKNIAKKIKNKYLGSVPGVYDFSFENAWEVERFGYSNSRPVKFGLMAETDELRAALANFNVRVFPEGKLVVSSESIELRVERIGIYIEDAYDFNDASDDYLSQPLGFWNFNGIANPLYAVAANISAAQAELESASSPYMTPEESKSMFTEVEGVRYFYVTNSHFTRYRAELGKGGDFQVLSDVLYQSVPLTIINVWDGR
jgi:hypothetical protein